MKRTHQNWPLLPEASLGEQARALADELRLYRDLRYERGSPASYELTGFLAQLALAADLLDQSPAEQDRVVRDLLQNAHCLLRQLQGRFDA